MTRVQVINTTISMHCRGKTRVWKVNAARVWLVGKWVHRTQLLGAHDGITIYVPLLLAVAWHQGVPVPLAWCGAGVHHPSTNTICAWACVMPSRPLRTRHMQLAERSARGQHYTTADARSTLITIVQTCQQHVLPHEGQASNTRSSNCASWHSMATVHIGHVTATSGFLPVDVCRLREVARAMVASQNHSFCSTAYMATSWQQLRAWHYGFSSTAVANVAVCSKDVKKATELLAHRLTRQWG
jgi:hypothetical protein